MPLHPLRAISLTFPLPMFLSAWLADLAYSQTFEVQWVNFSSWLIVGGLLAGAVPLAWALIALRSRRLPGRRRRLIHVLALATMWMLGLIDVFVHARDAWATMPTGLYLSAIVALLALLASWTGYSPVRDGGDR